MWDRTSPSRASIPPDATGENSAGGMRVPREFVRGLCMRVVGSICCECTEVSRRNDPETDRDFDEDRFSAEDAEDAQSTQRTRLRAEGAPFPRVLRATSASRALKSFAYASRIPAARPAI